VWPDGLGKLKKIHLIGSWTHTKSIFRIVVFCTLLGSSGYRKENNIKKELRELGWNDMHWIHPAQVRYQLQPLVKMLWDIWFHRVLENSRVLEPVLMSQDWPSSMELAVCFVIWQLVFCTAAQWRTLSECYHAGRIFCLYPSPQFQSLMLKLSVIVQWTELNAGVGLCIVQELFKGITHIHFKVLCHAEDPSYGIWIWDLERGTLGVCIERAP
jgi:hypothetical protein